MTTKHSVENTMQVSEAVIDDNVNMVAVSVPYTEAGSVYVAYYFHKPEQPYLRGEDYSVLVQVWDNKEDDIYDTL